MTKLLSRFVLVCSLTALGLVPAACQPLRVMQKTAVTSAPPPTEPADSFRVNQLVFHTDVDIKQDQALFDDLGQLSESVFTELSLPPSTALIQVYVFKDESRFHEYMTAKYPSLPSRRAFFISEKELNVYTFWSDKSREDLRHELTHALLNSVLKEVPLWLDEGLAENFELPPERKGVSFKHLTNLRSKTEHFVPDLARLEGLKEIYEMRTPEYREAWAWVHLMLHSGPEPRKVLVDYLHTLRTTDKPGLLYPKLAAVFPSPEEALAKHLESLDTGKHANSVAEK